MNSIKPYLIRAVHQWAVDAGLTPHVMVDVTVEGVRVPQAYVKDNQIVLNIHPQAVSDLSLGDDWLMFSARFSGQGFAVEFPVSAVRAIYARENGQGLTFPAESPSSGTGKPSSDKPEPPSKKGPSLRVIK